MRYFLCMDRGIGLALLYGGMNCIVTAGPTCEPLDEVRRLTNFSTGRLGSLLANHLAGQGHTVTLLLGRLATWHGEHKARHIQTFETTADLRERLHALAGQSFDAVYHAAAVSDFRFGKIWERLPSEELHEIKAGKLGTREGILLAELVPTPKLIAELRGWFSNARLTGWKYEVAGGRASVLKQAERQIIDNRTDACVANGPAYGTGYGLVTGDGEHTHLLDLAELFRVLEPDRERR
jgi:phosphopantothenate---cysteine ligase (CTP)